MALKIKPPTHRADALGVFVSVNDAAWDNALYLADLDAIFAAALAEKQGAAEAAHRAKHPAATDDEIAALRAACKLSEVEEHKAKGRHPVVRYVVGKTRFQLDAQDWAPDGKPCTVRERYLKGQAYEFTIRRLPYPMYQAADAVSGTSERLTAFARSALRAVKSPDYNWTAADDEARAPEAVIQVLHDADPSLPLELGAAVIAMCRPMDDEETFR